MADFYPVLSRAVSKLPVDDAHERQELYDKARAILLKQLRGSATSPSLMRQQASLEAAIRRIEAEIRVAIVRQGPLSRAISLAAEENITSRSRVGRAFAEPALTPSTDQLRLEEVSTPLEPSRCSPVDGAVAVQETVKADGHHYGAASVDAYQTGSEESFTFRNDAGAKPPIKTKAKFQSPGGYGEPLRKSEGLRPREKLAPHNIQSSEPLLHRLPVMIAVTTAVTLLVILAAMVLAPFIALHAGRFVWLSQHLFDNPAVLRSFVIVSAVFLLLAFPLFHFGRKKLRRSFSRR
jgi:hypothetical protein